MNAYHQRVNAENLANQAQPVQSTAKEILEEIRRIEQCLYWALNPEEKDGGQQWSLSLIEHAHALIDLAHAYRAALAVNPPPREDEAESA